MAVERQYLIFEMIPLAEKHIDAIVNIEQKSFGRPWSTDSFLTEFLRKDSYNFGVIPENQLSNEEIIAYISYRITNIEMHLMKIFCTIMSWY